MGQMNLDRIQEQIKVLELPYRNYGGMNEDINNNYYIKDNYGEENRMMNNMKRGGYSEVGLKGKNFNDNFNDNNPISNEYYK